MNSPVDTADVRRRNLSLVLRHVAGHGPCARTELAEATGLVHASITALTAELIGNGLIHDVGLASSGRRGRPRRLLELAPGRVAAMAIEVTATRLISAATDLDGTALWRDERAHGAAFGDPRPVAAEIARAVRDGLAAARSGGRATHLARVVLAVPGAVVEDEIVADSILLGWRRVDLRALVRAEPAAEPYPLSVVNEANMAAFAEYRALTDRTGEAPRAFAYLRGSGSGIGGGLVVDGAVQTGGHGMAGEFGHIPVCFDGPACKCGDHGCLVTYLGLRALTEAAGIESGAEPDLIAAGAEFDRRLRGADPAAVRALETGARALATALTAVSRVADPERVVLGGHLAAWSPWLVPTVLRHLAGRRAVTPTDEPVLSTDLLGRDATVRGALRYACESVLDDPAGVPVLAG